MKIWYMPPANRIIKKIENVDRFREILANNPGIILLKLGATWCGPCKRIEPEIHAVFDKMPATVQCIQLDIDESIEIYSFLKNKRVVNGVPVLLCYKQGNLNYVPNDIVIGAGKEQLMAFFDRCFFMLKNL